MSNREQRRRIGRLVNKGWKQIQQKDYRPTSALKALVSGSLDLQPGFKTHIEAIIPMDIEPESFVIEALQAHYFHYITEEGKLWLCKVEDGAFIRLGTITKKALPA